MNDAEDGNEIVYVWPYLTWGGAQIYYFGLMKLVRKHYPVTAVMPRGSAERLMNYLRELDIPCEFFEGRLEGTVNSFGDRVRRRLRKIHVEWVLGRYLSRRRSRNTILHLEIAPWSSFLLLAYLSLRGNVFVTLHTALPELSSFRYVSWLLKFRALSKLRRFHLLVSNRDTRESLRPYLPGEYLSRVPIAYSGIDGDEIRQALAAPLDRVGWRQRFGIPADAFLVFGLGQFIDRKGHRTLLEAARELRDEHPQLFFVWLGTDELDEAGRRLIAESGVLDRFRYVSGRELGGDRMSLLQSLRVADLYVLPSLQEGLPIALLEAMALGIPCIASDINAIPEAVVDGQTGILVPPGEGGALAEAISEMIQDPAARERMAAAAQQLVRSQFDERVAAETTLALYESCWNN